MTGQVFRNIRVTYQFICPMNTQVSRVQYRQTNCIYIYSFYTISYDYLPLTTETFKRKQDLYMYALVIFAVFVFLIYLTKLAFI